VIDRAQLEARQTVFVSDVLRDVPGVAVSRLGAPGSLTQVRMRGGEANHTLVLLNGADISDPFAGEFDFSGLLAGDIERIEILRGSQSALYGSDAIGGVINIIPRRGNGPLAFEALAQAGSFDTWQTAANAGYGDDTFDVFASASHHATSGTNISRFGSERDGERDSSLFLNAGLRPAQAIELRGLLRYVDTTAKTDPQDFDFPPGPTFGFIVDGNDKTTTRQLYGALSAEARAFGDRWQTRLTYAFADASRDNFGATFSASDGDRSKLSLVSGLTFDTGVVQHKLTGAIDWTWEGFSNAVPDFGIDARGRSHAVGITGSYDLSLGDFDGGFAFRHDNNSRFKDADTYRLQASYRLSESTRLRATSGSGIKDPTYTELFGFDPITFIGNPKLKPEKSTGWDAGIDQTFADGRVRVTATYFNARLKDEIFTDFSVFPFTAGNRATKSKRQGVELTLQAALDDDWSVGGQYTYLRATENGEQEVRRAPHIASLDVTRRIGDRGAITITARYNGAQRDNAFTLVTPPIVKLHAFTLVNVDASYKLNDNVELFGRVENLTNEKYEEVFSYRSPGISAAVGARTRF
jgi:vitamin B12 transporter